MSILNSMKESAKVSYNTFKASLPASPTVKNLYQARWLWYHGVLAFELLIIIVILLLILANDNMVPV